jgi:hypothetical protein
LALTDTQDALIDAIKLKDSAHGSYSTLKIDLPASAPAVADCSGFSLLRAEPTGKERVAFL